MSHYDRCHVYVASVTDWPSLVLSPSLYLPCSSLSSVSVFQHILISLPHFSFLCSPPCLINRLILHPPPLLPSTRSISGCVVVVFFAAERRALHHDAAGWDAARHRCRDEVPVRHELCPPGPRCPEYPGQQQLGLQGLRLWPVTLSGRHFCWPHLHKLPGQSVCL